MRGFASTGLIFLCSQADVTCEDWTDNILSDSVEVWVAVQYPTGLIACVLRGWQQPFPGRPVPLVSGRVGRAMRFCGRCPAF